MCDTIKSPWAPIAGEHCTRSPGTMLWCPSEKRGWVMKWWSLRRLLLQPLEPWLGYAKIPTDVMLHGICSRNGVRLQLEETDRRRNDQLLASNVRKVIQFDGSPRCPRS